MDGLESVFLFLDYLTDTKRKRHRGFERVRHLPGGGRKHADAVAGGDASLFFGGLAFTMMTIKGEEADEKTDA